ncbi:hypothetical protein [Helicobacter sp. T3_23-1056]
MRFVVMIVCCLVLQELEAQKLPNVLENGKKCLSQMKTALDSNALLESQLPLLEECLERELTLPVSDDSHNEKLLDTFIDAIDDEKRDYLKKRLSNYLERESSETKAILGISAGNKNLKITLPSAIRVFWVNYSNECRTIHNAKAKIYIFNEAQNFQDALYSIYFYEDIEMSDSPFRDELLAKIIAKNKGAWSYDSRKEPEEDDLWDSKECFETTKYRAMRGNKKIKTLSNADFISGEMLHFGSRCSRDAGRDIRYTFAGFSQAKSQEKTIAVVLISHSTGWNGWCGRRSKKK